MEFLETYFSEDVTRQWVIHNWGDWHYAKFFFWGFFYMATRWLIPLGLFYDAAFLVMQWGAFEFGMNEAQMDRSYGSYKKTWVKIFVLNSQQKAGIVVLFVFCTNPHKDDIDKKY